MIEKYFDISNFQYADIFSGIDKIWEVISKIKNYSGGKLINGRNCKISNSALIRGGVILGDNIVVGHCVELKNCVIMNNTAVAHLNYVGDSILGNNVNISGGVVLANYRLDKKAVKIKISGELISTGLRKFSAVVGDGSIIGVNAVLNPGTILEKNCTVFPLVSAKGYYPAGSVIK